MAGNHSGGKKAAETNKKRYGDDFYQKLGAKSGSISNPNKGFGSNRKRAVEAGRKAGKLSKVGYKYLYTKRGFNYYESKTTGERVSFRAN
jgi:general stress protein YciG